MGICSRGYERLIPDRFLKGSVVAGHRFSVIEPWWQAFDLVQLKFGKLEVIEPSAYCKLLVGNKYLSLLIPAAENQQIASLIYDLAHLSSGTRSAKYVALFKLYESLCAPPKIAFAALRHSFTHARSVLNRPKTVAALQSMFGTVHVNLNRLSHQTVFWSTYGELLVEVDRLVSAEVRLLGDKVRMPQRFKGPITRHMAQYYFPKLYAKLPNNAFKGRRVEDNARP